MSITIAHDHTLLIAMVVSSMYGSSVCICAAECHMCRLGVVWFVCVCVCVRACMCVVWYACAVDVLCTQTCTLILHVNCCMCS